MGTELEHNAQYYFERALAKIYTRTRAKGDLKGGLADLDQAILLSPTTVQYYIERAKLFHPEYDQLARMNELTQEVHDRLHQRQLDDLNMILSIGAEIDDLIFAHRERESWYRLFKRYHEQLADINWLIEHDYDGPYLYEERATCEFRLGQFENALNDYVILLRLDPDNTHALFERAQVYYNMQRYQEALDDLNKLLSFETHYPSSSIDYSWRARCYYRLGKMDEARRDFIKSTELAGGTPLDISAVDYMRILWTED